MAVRRRLAEAEPERLRAWSAQAVAAFAGEESAQRIEAMFHRLVAGPDAEAAEALHLLREEWVKRGRHEDLQALALALDELLRLSVLSGPMSQARSLFSLVDIRGENLPVKAREAKAREALALFSATGVEHGQMQALHLLGEILLSERTLDEAGECFREFGRIASARAQVEPGDLDRQRALFVSHDLSARLLIAQGKRAAALASYLAGLAIAKDLAAKQPEHTERQRDLAISHNRIGDLLAAQGDRVGALGHYQVSFAIRERLALQDPGHVEWQRDLALSYMRLAESMETVGDRGAALGHYHQALTIAEKLNWLDPANAVWQNDLAWLRSQIARLERSAES